MNLGSSLPIEDPPNLEGLFMRPCIQIAIDQEVLKHFLDIIATIFTCKKNTLLW